MIEPLFFSLLSLVNKMIRAFKIMLPIFSAAVEMFLLRDSSSTTASSTDPFGWWIGTEVEVRFISREQNKILLLKPLKK